MRTSNKILTGFLVLVFIVPFLLASVLKSKVEKGEYTVVKNNNNTNPNRVISRPLGSVKVLHVAASDPRLLHCKLTMSDSARYSYPQYSGADSLNIYQSNDTLFILHPSKFFYVEIEVFLPRFDNVIADGASVFVDSLPTPSGSFNVTLKNGGTVAGERR